MKRWWIIFMVMIIALSRCVRYTVPEKEGRNERPTPPSSKAAEVGDEVVEVELEIAPVTPEERMAASVQWDSGLLVNGGFEGSWTRNVLWWTADGGPYTQPFGEIFTPEGWTTWWVEGIPCSGTAGWVTGRPEARLVHVGLDPLRIWEGDQAASFFTFYRCHLAGYMQRVDVPAGRYRAGGRIHAWFTRCSPKPHSGPLEEDCVTAITWAYDVVRVGIDPTGGQDPRAQTVVWSDGVEIYGVYGPEVWVEAETDGGYVTVFVESDASHPLKHCDVYVDAMRLERVVRVWLPLVGKNGE